MQAVDEKLQLAERSKLLDALYAAQKRYGYLTKEALRDVAEELGLPLKDVYSTASFYSLYHMKPTGQYVIQVCEGLVCSLRGGAERLVDYLRKKLDIDVGETTPDGKFTLQTVQCLAACDASPAMRVNDDLYENLTLEEVDAIIDMLAGG
ncbi:MAG TPA: NAD(P)H-dependent oxidoreductase subunit E [Chloroflexi bacterium]|nr:NAD(P)H-dependent oxidoreductase subunit E [Chloroflexota bacterium]